MQQVMFIEVGMGIDLHGQDVNQAAVRAVRNAIGHNSMPGIRTVLPDHDLQNMKVHILLAVPSPYEGSVDQEVVAAGVPYGEKQVQVVTGGLVASSGIVLADQGDENDHMVVVNAVVSVGY